MKQQQSDNRTQAGKAIWRRLIVAVIFVMLLLISAAWIAYDRMTDKLLEALMDETMSEHTFNALTDAAPAPLDNITGTNTQEDKDKPSAETGLESGKPTNETSGKEGSKDSIKDSGKATHSEADRESPHRKANKSAEQPPVKGGGSTAAPEAGKRPNISKAEAEKAAGSVTISEKIEIGSVLLRHWDHEELKSFRAALSGGLTIEEKRELKRKAMEVLSEDEYDRLISIAHKYGLSRGKSYKQSLNEENMSRNQPKE
ncbi:hypothetical protein [Paenibacillus spongiae]|uniref:Uncharacterized protein n=1 Tax=Paenibacillus spongiae TaxID=2909671 RepID=A0ABY5S2M1_9BACL|nr:hypothetical protein [Paenibacillus spongiae]UVI27899.1 hypothetical protein L1F29_20855 [Paenibacillus spongiae]